MLPGINVNIPRYLTLGSPSETPSTAPSSSLGCEYVGSEVLSEHVLGAECRMGCRARSRAAVLMPIPRSGRSGQQDTRGARGPPRFLQAASSQ